MATKKTYTGLTEGTWAFRFLPRNKKGQVGEWSAFFQYTVTGDTTPPPVPSAPVAEAVLGGAYVKWVDSGYQTPIDFNRVDVYVSSGGPYTKFGSIATINGGITYSAPEGATGPFTFKFTGVDRSGNVSAFSGASNSVTPLSLDIDVTPPNAPSNLSVTAYSDSSDKSGATGYVEVSWTPSSSTDLLGHYIRYGRSATVWDSYEFIEKGQNTKRISNLRAGTTYYFQVNATDGSNPSVYIPSTPVSATIPGDTSAPAAPTGLVVVAGFNNIIAYWNRNSEGDVDLGRGTYQFQLATVSTFAAVLQDRVISGTVASFTGLTTGVTYYVRVRAIDSSGNAGSWTTPGNATPGKINAELSISEGTIVGNLVAASTIVGDKLIANTIDADRLKTNTGIVGRLYVGDDAGSNKITIDGIATVPAVYYGTGNYSNSDTPFYFDALGKFSLKDQLTWNGAQLSVKGSLNVTQASTFGANVTLNSGGDIILNGGAIRATGTSGRVEIGSAGVFGYNATSGGTALFSLFANTGQIKVDGGTIGGWTVNTNSITTTNSGGQTVGLYSNGQLYMGPNFSVGADGSVTVKGVLTIVGTGSNVASTAALDAVNTTATNASTTATNAANTAATANTNATNALNTANAALPATGFNGNAIASKINDSLTTTTIDGGRITTGTVVAGSVVSTWVYAGTINADNITSGTLTSRAINNGNGTFSVTSSGVLTATSATISGTITASSGSIGGFNITGVTDIEARTADRPRILFGSKIHIGWDDDYTYANNYYAVKVGNPFSTATSRFLVNTKDNVFRASVDTSATSYAMEVRNTLRAANLRYITSLVNEGSSRRFKENITYTPKNYYERILNVSPAFYKYKDSHDEIEPEMYGVHSFGMIAEDLEEAGLGYFVERNLNGQPTNLLNMHEFPQLLIPIVKDLKNEISELKARIEILEGNNA